MEKIKYIKGNKDRAEEIKQVFINLSALNDEAYDFNRDFLFYYIKDNRINVIRINDPLSQLLIKYGEEIELPKKNELPKTWEEWIKTNPYIKEEFYISTLSTVDVQNNYRKRSKYCYNNLSSKEDAEGLLALIKLKRLRDCYNDGWKPDWEDDMQPKFCIELVFNKTNCVTCWNTHAFLSFKNAELRNEFLNNFRELIEKAKMWL